MNRLVWILALIMFMGCSKKGGDKEGSELKASDWPKGVTVTLSPSLGAEPTLKAGQNVKVIITNSTAEIFKYEWSSDNKCGKLLADEEKKINATYTAGANAGDCDEVINIKATGKSSYSTYTINLKVKGDPKATVKEDRPAALPEDWIVINDYEKTLEQVEFSCYDINKVKDDKGNVVDNKVPQSYMKYVNSVKGITESWGYESGECTIQTGEGTEKGALNLSFDLPKQGDYCGLSENLEARPEECSRAGSRDLTEIEYISFSVKSGDDKDHQFQLELIVWDRLADGNQGDAKKPLKPIVATKDWQRVMIPVTDFVKDDLQSRAGVKSLDFRFNRVDGFPDAGKIIVDNIALVPIKKSKK